MEITGEQRRRAEANRLAALEKRKRLAEAAAARDGEWKLSGCQKTSTQALPRGDVPPLQQGPRAPVEQPCRFRVVLEICSPDEFCVTPQPLPGFSFPGEAECFRKIDACLSSAAVLCCTEIMGQRKTSIYKLKDYEIISGHLRRLQGLQLHEVPYKTRMAIEKSCCHFAGERWTSGRAPHLPDNEVDELLSKLPKLLRDALLPFQLEGVRFGLRRGGSCLIADEMGLGKTIQAIAIACCFISEGPILVICPAVLRFSWAEELEHWVPFCLPTDIHLVFGHQDNVDHLERFPKVVVISYTMLHRLRRSMLKRHWALVIVDESHNIRCTKKALECEE
ncbi:hypothetical protein Taro_006455, partial [Colocasia esculenta]|nr:hypothetical protein [Colocasia esculenta]